MPKTDILKLVFHHDQRLDDLAPSSSVQEDNPLAMFTQPDPTFSTLYFSGTDLESQTFGLNVLKEFEELLDTFEIIVGDMNLMILNHHFGSVKEAIEELEVGSFVVWGKDEISIDSEIDDHKLREYLEMDLIVLFKREAKDGFDLHFFSKKNIYTKFFYPLQAMLPDSFRLFSMNGKRISSEQKFFFETWALDRSPHGTEEVHPESVL